MGEMMDPIEVVNRYSQKLEDSGVSPRHIQIIAGVGTIEPVLRVHGIERVLGPVMMNVLYSYLPDGEMDDPPAAGDPRWDLSIWLKATNGCWRIAPHRDYMDFLPLRRVP